MTPPARTILDRLTGDAQAKIANDGKDAEIAGLGRRGQAEKGEGLERKETRRNCQKRQQRKDDENIYKMTEQTDDCERMVGG